MKKFLAGMMLAGLVLGPVSALMAETKTDVSLIESAKKSVAQAEADYQKGLASQDLAQKAADKAAADLAKAQTDLKLAQSSGDKEKIKAAQDAMLKAKRIADDKALVLRKVVKLVERLKMILDKAKATAVVIAAAKTPEEARKALHQLQQLVNSADNAIKSIEVAMKPRPPIDITGVTVPSTTTSTTKPTPTQVGQIRG